MATLSIEQKKRRQRISTVLINMTEAVQESMYDYIVTFTTMIVALIAVFAAANGIAFLIGWGMFIIISVYQILLVMRILRRMDQSYTNDELGEMLEKIIASQERIERNV